MDRKPKEMSKLPQTSPRMNQNEEPEPSTSSQRTATDNVFTRSFYAIALPSTSRDPPEDEFEEIFRGFDPHKTSSTCTDVTSQLLFEDMYFDDIDDLFADMEENLEEEAVAAKFKLALRSVGSCSCIRAQLDQQSDMSIESGYTNTPDPFLNEEVEPEFFFEASKLYEMSTAQPSGRIEGDFLEARQNLSEQYPFYWRHISRKYETNYRPEYYLMELTRKNLVVNSCRRLIREEERYSKIHHGNIGFKRHVRIDGKMSNLNQDFKAACNLMREEYPVLFIYLIEKLEFSKIMLEKKIAERNKRHIVELSKQPPEKLKELNDKYKKEEEKH